MRREKSQRGGSDNLVTARDGEAAEALSKIVLLTLSVAEAEGPALPWRLILRVEIRNALNHAANFRFG